MKSKDPPAPAIITFPHAARPSVEPTTEQDPVEASRDQGTHHSPIFVKHINKALKHLACVTEELEEAKFHGEGLFITGILNTLALDSKRLRDKLKEPKPKIKHFDIMYQKIPMKKVRFYHKDSTTGKITFDDEPEQKAKP